MGLKDCSIVFDNPHMTYYVGQTVTGRAVINLDAPKKVRGISITFKGEASTSWTVSESHTDRDGKYETTWVEVSGNEEYFKINYFVAGGQGDSEFQIPAGTQTYPFTCVLPPTLPSSFEGEHGYIRYTVKVKLDRPWKFDQEFKTAFTVLSPLDLNLMPHLKQPVRRVSEKFFCCCWCKSGPLTCVVALPYSGYVPGQDIPITLEVDNISNVSVDSIHIVFQKNVTYHSRIPQRETKKVSVDVSAFRIDEEVEGHASRTWNHKLNIPPLPPSNLVNCGIIDLDYKLLIEVEVSGLHQDISFEIPITIGTIPLLEAGPPSMPPGMSVPSMHPGMSVPSIPPGISVPSLPYNMPIVPNAPPADSVSINMNNQQPVGWNANNAANIMPPSYQECMYGTASIQDKSDNQHTQYSNNKPQYSPMYPVYNYSQKQ